MTTLRYFSIMGVSAALGVMRAVLAAMILSVDAFGTYAVTVALAFFASSFLGAFIVDKTTKSFPIAWAAGESNEVLSEILLILKQILIRAAVLLILLVLTQALTPLLINHTQIILLVILAAAQTLLSLYASATRATLNTKLLAQTTLLRSILILMCVLLGAWYLSWQGAVFGEALGGLLAVLYTNKGLAKTSLQQQYVELRTNATKTDNATVNSGRYIFLNSLCQNLVNYLDKPIVASLYDFATAGVYALLLNIVTVSNVFVGIVIQKLGPQLISLGVGNTDQRKIIKYTSLWILVSIGFSTLLSMIILISFTIGLIPRRLEEYGITLSLLFPIIILSCLQFSSIIDFYLYSLDIEKASFLSSFAWSFLFLAISYVAYVLKLPFITFLWTTVLLKTLHIAAQIAFAVKGNLAIASVKK